MNQNTDVLINFVLDRSGSMTSIHKGTIDGFNQFLAEQKDQPGDARMSLTFFDTSFDPRFVAVPLSEIDPLGTGNNPYSPNGGTALCDAVATTIKGTEAWLANHPEFIGRVVCVVLTDGGENSSTEWHINVPLVEGDERDVAGLIQYKQTEGWEFVFLGSGGSEWLERSFGHVVDKSQFFGYANTDMANNMAYAGVSSTLTATRSTGKRFTAT